MIEDVEEGGNSLLGSSPLLYVIDNQHVDRLIEIDEVVNRVLTTGICELHLKQTCRNVEHTFLRIGLLTAQTDGIDEMSLTTSRGTIDEERVECRLTRMIRNREANGARQLIAVALDKRLESLLQVELRIQLLG